MTRLSSLTWLVLFFALVLALLCGGCAQVTPGQVHEAAGTVTGRLQGVQSDLQSAKPHADQYGQSRIDSAIAGIVFALGKMPIFETAASELAKAQAMNAWFFSPRQHALFWTAVTIIAGLGVLSLVFYFIAGTNPVGIWKVGASIAIKIFGLIPTVVTQIVAFLHMRALKHGAVATAVTNTLSLPPGTITAPPTPAQLDVLSTHPPMAFARVRSVPSLAEKLGVIPPAAAVSPFAGVGKTP